MSQTLNAAAAVIGIDIGKNSFMLSALMTAAQSNCVRSGRVGRRRHGLRTCHHDWSAWRPASVFII